MTILLILIPVTLVLVGIAVATFFWAVNKGQFDDLDTPALRILEADPLPPATGSGLSTDATAVATDKSAPTPPPTPPESVDRDAG
ncbi:MAG: cbb3-type cytochrome oxidase assembly protein CcoS [Xanthomonadales bacterium]|nr:cbb3-type cytochrome oxidase assembly protein CcoS [Xanthomonadales bacterium]